MLGWEGPLDAVHDRRRQAQIPTPVIVRSAAVMFLSRLGSLNALDESRPSRFWEKWLGQALPSADTRGRVAAQVDAAGLRALHHHVYARLTRLKALPPPANETIPYTAGGSTDGERRSTVNISTLPGLSANS